MILAKLTELVSKDYQARQVIEELKAQKGEGRGEGVRVGGITSGLAALLCSFVSQELKSFFVLVVTPSLKSAEKMYSDLLNFVDEEQIELFHPLDAFPHEPTEPSLDLQGQRIGVLHRVVKGEVKILIAPLKAIIFKLGEKKLLRDKLIEFKLGKKVVLDELSHSLVDTGFQRVSLVGEKGEFAIRGGIIDIFPPKDDYPWRIELDGEQVASIRSFDVISQRSSQKVDAVEILPAKEEIGHKTSNLFNYLPKSAVVMLSEKIESSRVIDDLLEEVENAEKIDQKEYKNHLAFTSIDELMQTVNNFKTLLVSAFSAPDDLKVFNHSRAHSYLKQIGMFIDEQKKRIAQNQKTVIVSRHNIAVGEILHDAGLGYSEQWLAQDITVLTGKLSKGFNLDDLKLLVLSDFELFGEETTQTKHERVSTQGADQIHTFELVPEEFIVHENYGIGKFLGLEVLEDVGPKQEYLKISYAGGDLLYVPLNSMGLISKYSWGGEFQPKLDKLGSKRWQNTKDRTKKRIKDMTKELLSLYAERETLAGFSFAPDDIWQKELSASFHHVETKDQRRAIVDVKKDMETARPMDRLICGDVGYGKTEVAIRAAVKAVSSGKQVAVLVPTTVLAQQHFITFSERLKSFPIKVAMLSRFRSKAEQEKIVEDLKLGKVDVVVGTHRLLGKEVGFKDLGLLIIDEEHRFGVTHKEKVKRMRRSVDVLTLTATPIPRTLYMSLSGIRDLSMINTPPVDRSPVRTYVLEWNEAAVKEAILRETERGGQVYFVHNLVHSIDQVRANLQRLVPDVKIVVAHGQMKESDLEQNVIDFFQKKYDLLLCTAIIESGIDMPNVNTIIIDNADRMGLAQLYQLRGRVGRSATRAYAYLLYRREDFLTPEAMKRLKAIQEFTKLGSGYKLALRDLEIRGAGNVLGAEQHGHLVAVGFDLYCELVREAVDEFKGIKETSPREVVLDVKVDAFIPPHYVEDERERIALYRRMNLLATKEEVLALKEELVDRFGEIPRALNALFRMLYLKVRARLAGVKSIRGDKRQILVDFAGIPHLDVIDKKIVNLKDRVKMKGKRLYYDVSGVKTDEWISKLSEIFAEKLA